MMTTGSTNKLTFVGLIILVCCLPEAYQQVINGDWSPWSATATKCTVTCGGGNQSRVRSCTKPMPEGGGILCLTLTNERKMFEMKVNDCNMQVCWDGQEYTDWGNCSEWCGKGVRKRQAKCGNDTCEGEQFKEQEEPCNTWNKTTCPDPCLAKTCPDMAVCYDKSTDTEPVAECGCTMGHVMVGNQCKRPPPTTPTPRPIPTLPPEQKVVATVISKSASTVIIICVSICLVLFLILRIFTPDRVIQMNMEIALLMAHVMLVLPSSIVDVPIACAVVSIMVHFFFTACFMFMLLEALHMYVFVAYVVKQKGMCSRMQNTMVGWGLAAFIVLFCMCFEFKNYGAKYHCWLQMDTPLLYGQLIPIIFMVIITFTLIEAAGAADYTPLKDMDEEQITSAKFSQRTNLVILPLVFSHMLIGMLSEYEQNLALYSIFSILNSVTGVVVLLFHCFNNQEVRSKMKGLYKKMCKKG